MTIILTEISMTTVKPHESRWKVFKGHLVLVFILLPCTHCGEEMVHESCTVFPTDTPEITLLAWVPHLHLTATCQAYTGSEGAWPADNPDGVVCALAQHKPSLHPWALVVVLSPFLTPQRCQINPTLLVWGIQTPPHPPPISIQGTVPQEMLLWLVVLRDPHPNLCSSIT